MLERSGIAALVLGGVALIPAQARAQYHFHADPSVRLTGGYNVTEVFSDQPNSVPQIQNGPLATIGPSLLMALETPKTTQKLTLTGTLSAPLNKDFTLIDRVPQYNLRANYTSTTPLNPITLLTLTAALTAAPINPYTTLQDPTLTPLDAPPAQASYNMTATGTESLKRDLSQDTHLTQSTNVVYNFPFNVDTIRPTTFTFKNSLAGTKTFSADAVTATLSIVYTHFGVGESAGGVIDPRAQFLNTFTGTWKRPLSESATLAIDFGISEAFSLDAPAEQFWSPTGGFHLTYNFDPIAVTLNYTHAALASIYTATTNQSDQLGLRSSLPLGKTGLLLAGTMGFTHAIPIGSDINIAPGFNSYTADVGLTFTPQAIPKLSIAVRGNVARQIPIDDPLGATTHLGITSTIAFSYPNAKAHDIVSNVAPAYIPTPSIGEEVPVGAELTPLAPGEEPVPVGPVEPGEGPPPPEGPEAPAPPPATP
jgi:hypothetical protein